MIFNILSWRKHSIFEYECGPFRESEVTWIPSVPEMKVGLSSTVWLERLCLVLQRKKLYYK